MRKILLLITLLALVNLVTISSSRAQCSSDAREQFAVTSNPNGLWSYLYTETPTSELQYMFVDPLAPSCQWTGNVGLASYPDVSTCTGGSIILQSNELTLSPGPLGSKAILRWSAPNAGEWMVNMSVRGVWQSSLVDAGLTLAIDGSTLFSDTLRPLTEPPVTWSGIVSANADSVIDFTIDVGPNGLHDWDRVALALTVSGAGVAGDLNGDCTVNGSDLAVLLGAWGAAGSIADLDRDGLVAGADLAILLGSWVE